MNVTSAHPSDDSEHPRVVLAIARRPLWRIRLERGLPRYVLYALALAGLLASARFALDPPRTALPASLLRRPALEDLAAEGFATLFARAYLTWEAQHPEAREHALAPFVGSGMDADAGLQPPVGPDRRAAAGAVDAGRSAARTSGRGRSSTRSPPKPTRRGCSTSP